MNRKRFTDLPIDRKISWSILITSFSALAICAVALVGHEVATFRREAINEHAALVEIVAANSVGALAFGDFEAADRILATLKDRPSIVEARLFDQDGRPFASFVRGTPSIVAPDLPPTPKVTASRHRLTITRPVAYEADTIGTIVVESNLSALYSRLWRYAAIAGTIVIVLIPFVFALSSYLKRVISNPIRRLARVASSIATHQDYSIRTEAVADDEVGQLTRAFNHMLNTIELRDRMLVHQASELARSNKELEQFAYISSHDLQEPLRKITTLSEMLRERFGNTGDPDMNRVVASICSSSARMRALIIDLLTYSRVTRKGLDTAQLDLNDIVSDVLSDLESRPPDATITVDPLPKIEANTFQIRQLFQNLIANALKFRGNERPRVRITAKTNGAMWTFGVQDNGIGIDPKYTEQIFDVFQRLHTRDAYPGTGIGLAICRKIVEQNGGRIWVESEPGRGSTFYFTWPVEKRKETQVVETIDERRRA